MKFQIMLSYAFLATLVVCGCLADDDSSEEDMDVITIVNSTTYNSTSESNETVVPVIILVEEGNRMQTQYNTDSDYAAQNLNWLVVKKITNITVTKESSVDPETKRTKDVVVENRAEEYRMFHDDRHRSALTEKDIRSVPFPMRFL